MRYKNNKNKIKSKDPNKIRIILISRRRTKIILHNSGIEKLN